jgi:glycine/D-amino acid oxidase-like deaminating enzyme/nitrite reductase/ring-hydroxylating ferredoxin subunit
MKPVTSDETRSVWMEASVGLFEPLPGDREVDVAVIGGGITGATTALLLKRRGHRVAILDAGLPGHGETTRTTAHLTQVLDTRYRWIIDHLDRKAATQAALAHGSAIDTIERLVAELAIDCDFERVPGYLFTEDADGDQELQTELDAVTSMGLPARLVDGPDVPLPFAVRGGLRFERQAQLHAIRYLRGLLEAVHGDGSTVYARTRALGIKEGEPCRVETDRGTVTSHAVVLAAHVPITNRVLMHTKIFPYRSYVIAVPGPAPRETALFWDTKSPYHYLRTCRVEGQTMWLVGGEDHKVGHRTDTEACFEALEQYTAARIGEGRVYARWSGQIIEPADALPYIGRNSLQTRVFVATGFSGNGMTGGTVAAQILAEEIEGRTHPFGEVFAATRVRPLASARAYVRENADVAKHLVMDRFRAPSPEVLSGLAAGEGRVIQSEGGPLAVYRAPTGHLSACSAVCTHLGCMVSWNTAEKTWDCPCHGSRYDAFGEVLNGPAIQPLERRNVITADMDEAEEREGVAPFQLFGPTEA